MAPSSKLDFNQVNQTEVPEEHTPWEVSDGPGVPWLKFHCQHELHEGRDHIGLSPPWSPRAGT